MRFLSSYFFQGILRPQARYEERFSISCRENRAVNKVRRLKCRQAERASNKCGETGLNMKTMIVLCGSSNTGKTTTLIDLADHLVNVKGGTLLSPQLGSPAFPKSPYYEISYTGKNIFIATGGDTQHIMSLNFDRVTASVDVFILSSRAQNGSKILSMIETFAQQHGVVPYYVAAVDNSPSLHQQIRQTRVDHIEKLI